MSDQLAAKPGDIFPMRLGRRLEGEIALGVRAHRAIVEVGRTDAQEAVIDDHHLAVHHDGGGLAPIPRRRIEKANPVHDTSRHEFCDESAAAALHGLRFEPGRMHLRRDDQNTKLWHVEHPLRQEARDVDGAGELVLDVDEAVGCIDGRFEQPRDLVHAGFARGCDLGPGDAYRHSPRLHRHRGRPALARDVDACFDRAAGGPPPALRHFRQADRRFAIHHALHVVKRRIGLAVGIDAERMMGVVRAGVPAPYREVEAADKGKRAVNDDDLLVLRRAQGKAGVRNRSKAGPTLPR